MIRIKTPYERFLTININDSENEQEVLKFYFKNSIAFMNYNTRKFRSGVKVSHPVLKSATYYEYDKYTNIILSYPIDENNNIGECNGEIVLSDFISSMKRTHDLIKG